MNSCGAAAERHKCNIIRTEHSMARRLASSKFRSLAVGSPAKTNFVTLFSPGSSTNRFSEDMLFQMHKLVVEFHLQQY
jgi:hypothetical protein